MIINIGGAVKSKEKLGEFLGIFSGDGSYCVDGAYHHQIRIHLNIRDRDYISYVEKLLLDMFKTKPSLYVSEKYNVAVLRLRSKLLIEFIHKYLGWQKKKTKTVSLIRSTDSYSRGFIIGFLRGLTDTDGHINTNSRVVICSTISKRLAKNFKEGLDRIGINYGEYLVLDRRKNRQPLFRVKIARDFERFIKIVNPKHFNSSALISIGASVV